MISKEAINPQAGSGIFTHQRNRSGSGGLLALVVVLLGWGAVTGAMLAAYLAGEAREGKSCEWVCGSPRGV